MVRSWFDSVTLTESQQQVQSAVRDLCEDFDAEYWRDKDAEGEHPKEFIEEISNDGWFGVLIPEEYGGKGLGTEEAVVMMNEIAASGAGFSGAQTVHAGIYNSTPLVKYGSEEIKKELLPGVANGETLINCFSLTEPEAGSEATAITTQAERNGDKYVINGRKMWTSRIDVSDYLVLVARTTPREEVDRKTEGISLFLVDIEQGLDEGTIQLDEIDKTVSGVVNSFYVDYEDLHVPADHLIGEEDQGFYHVLDGLNDERLVIASECIGLGELAIKKGVEYADERRVFDRSIGQNQALQHPLAAGFARLLAAKRLTYDAATRTEEDPKTVGVWANTAKYLASEAAFESADAAVQVHGGRGVARDYDVERYFREARLTRLAPITQELALNYLGENVLGLPRSF